MGYNELNISSLFNWRILEPKNNLEQVPFTDSNRTCTHCSVRFLCPEKDDLEEAKIEQMSLMC